MIDMVLLQIIFLGKSLVLRFLGQGVPKWGQNEVFQVLWKVNAQNFSDFQKEIKIDMA